jgi:DNA-binding transcriptional ArsR family regulator
MRNDSIQDYINSCMCGTDADSFIKNLRKKAETIKSDEEFIQNLKIYEALGNENRFLIYKLLEQKELCTCVIAEILQMSQGTITHHLKKLIDSGLIVGKKSGYFTIYYTKKNFLTQYK